MISTAKPFSEHFLLPHFRDMKSKLNNDLFAAGFREAKFLLC